MKIFFLSLISFRKASELAASTFSQGIPWIDCAATRGNYRQIGAGIFGGGGFSP
jgi:hypothetical protein